MLFVGPKDLAVVFAVVLAFSGGAFVFFQPPASNLEPPGRCPISAFWSPVDSIGVLPPGLSARAAPAAQVEKRHEGWGICFCLCSYAVIPNPAAFPADDGEGPAFGLRCHPERSEGSRIGLTLSFRGVPAVSVGTSEESAFAFVAQRFASFANFCGFCCCGCPTLVF